ncbi:hypothetical protein CRM22_007979 [Opisthorchis felineus]|uniref:alpha-1,6-mannosyl-glycoprotein 6-beta-N-acetylglucosaminyltransferase n=1 Tax=Opisthorchis felineus TaxID=147828 RepID=A0A4S2LDV9_OPIFE|nr:hypothetical protein CRM22_007979 [Opisthorchis felineus]
MRTVLRNPPTGVTRLIKYYLFISAILLFAEMFYLTLLRSKGTDLKYVRKQLLSRIKVKYDLEPLLAILNPEVGHNSSYRFIHARLSRMWPQWSEGLKEYIDWNMPIRITRKNQDVDNSIRLLTMDDPVYLPLLRRRPSLRIHLHMGYLSGATLWENMIEKGGALGELVQWTDLLAGLYILGHNITVSMEESTTLRSLTTGSFDLVFTDIVGYRQIRQAAERDWRSNLPRSCEFRLLDSFGTEAQFNRGRTSVWGGLNLNLLQFYTMFPHTPDNTFLGFVVENGKAKQQKPRRTTRNQRKPIALISGKLIYMWEETKVYLRVLTKYVELHSNVADVNQDSIYGFIHNHHSTPGEAYLKLLDSAQIMVGLGFPYEGPAPLEAVAHGLVFLNVRFPVPHGRHNTKFFSNKPTSRKLSSQNPYMEHYMGEPYTYLIDKTNETDIRVTMERVLHNLPIKPYRRLEFSPSGYLERLNVLLTSQSFCGQSSQFDRVYPGRVSDNLRLHEESSPSDGRIIPAVGLPGQSCVEICKSRASPLQFSTAPVAIPTNWNFLLHFDYLKQRYETAELKAQLQGTKHLHCAPQYFSLINKVEFINRTLGSICSKIEYTKSEYAPYWDHEREACVFQQDPLKWDSSSYEPVSTSISRICPCRNALPGQVFLCPECV